MTVVVSANLLGPFHIAVDWITDKLYVAETRTSRIDVFTANSGTTFWTRPVDIATLPIAIRIVVFAAVSTPCLRARRGRCCTGRAG